jgi:hypothetical protein
VQRLKFTILAPVILLSGKTFLRRNATAGENILRLCLGNRVEGLPGNFTHRSDLSSDAVNRILESNNFYVKTGDGGKSQPEPGRSEWEYLEVCRNRSTLTQLANGKFLQFK